jgi:hypothetical protein
VTKKPKPTTPKRYDDAPDLATRIIRGIERIPSGVLALVRTWQGLVILLVLASQLLLPLQYYTARRDPHDERFAWRMFSPMRMTRCTPKFTIDSKPVNLNTEFHEAWIEIANRGRFVVIEQMAARLCQKNPGAAVHVVIECQYVGKEPATWGGYDMCKVPLL